MKQKDFAVNVFDDAKMRKYLPQETYLAITTAKKTNTTLGKARLDAYAKALFTWAEENGATRFTHFFQPLNGFSAEKRDSFFSVNETGEEVVKFRGKELATGEGDASSFPNGGLRQTFEARGVSRIDLSSNPFIKDGCLCIPTTFSSSKGESIDKKTPLLRSEAALNKQAVRLLKLLGYDVDGVDGVIGAEQEYFLIDENLYGKRCDLVYTGRTLFGAPPPKGQEFCDHYFRSTPQNVKNFMKDVDDELWKLGVVVRTEHNEVAPRQYELAPCYAKGCKHCEQNLMIMQTLKKCAQKHGLTCLLHEKPFADYNGSGKHNNWSLVTSCGENLFEAGNDRKSKLRRMLMIAAVIKAVDEYSDLLLASVCSAQNDLRLGGNEAPPRIISVFLGGLQYNSESGSADFNSVYTDRNRTSAIAFCGNKFEFRTVGSSANIADVNTVLNTATAESLRQFADTIALSNDAWQEAESLIKDVFEKHSKIIYDGNCYSEEWKKEAKKRGLADLSTAKAYTKLTDDKNSRLFAVHGVATLSELNARKQVLLETYCHTVKLEANCAIDIVKRQILPVLEKYAGSLADTAQNKMKLGLSVTSEKEKTEKISNLYDICSEISSTIREQLKETANLPLLESAEYLSEKVRKSLLELRKAVDTAETLCPKSIWPLPSYGEMLFGEKR